MIALDYRTKTMTPNKRVITVILHCVLSNFGEFITIIAFPFVLSMHGSKIGPLAINISVIAVTGIVGFSIIACGKIIKAYAINKKLAKLGKVEKELQATSSKYSSLCTQARNIFKIEIKDLHSSLNLRNEDVITFYIENNGLLHQHTRFSPVIKYNTPSCHPCEFGVLGKIWKEGIWFDNQFPTNGTNAYLQYARKHYNMKAIKLYPISRIFRTYFGIIISTDNYNIGVILVESNITDINEKYALEQVQDAAKRIERYLTIFKNDIDIAAPFTGDNE